MKKVILLSAVLIALVSCKKEEKINYKYADQPQVITCQNVNNQLINEAYYAFENALLTQAKNINRNPNARITTDYVLRNFIMRSRGVVKIEDYITKESVVVFKALQNEGLWQNGKLLSNSATLNCIGENISNKDLQTSFNALRSVEETLDPKLIVTAITNSRGTALYKDKALMAYTALELYYGKFTGKDFSTIEYLAEQPKEAVKKPEVTLKRQDLKKQEPKKLEIKKDPHAGHNHGPNDGHNH